MSREDLIEYLQSQKVFSVLDTEQLGVLADHAEEQSVAAGELLFSQTEAAEHFYLVLGGSIEVAVPAIMGPALVVQTLGKDDVLGWSWLIPPYKWVFDAKAREDSRVICFDGKSLLKHCEAHNDFGYALMKLFAGLMSERLHAARQKMMDNWAPAGWA